MKRSGILHRTFGVPLADKVRALRGRGLAEAKTAIARVVEDLIFEGFETNTAPTGNRWPARKPPTGSHPLLRLTYKMFDSFKVKASGQQISVKNAALSEQGRPYPLFHQNGTRKMFRRAMVPARGLPPKWKAEIDTAVRRALEKVK